MVTQDVVVFDIQSPMVTQGEVVLFDIWNDSPPSLAAKAIALGRKHHAYFKELQRIGTISGPVEINGWLCVPRDQDTSYIPREASKRVDWLREAGIPIVQEIVMHEPRPQQAEQGESAESTGLNKGMVLGLAALGVAAFAVVATAAVVVSAISAVTATAAATATAAVTTPTAVAAGVGLLALGLDPAYVCVLEDGNMDIRGGMARRIRLFLNGVRFIVPVAWRAAGMVFYDFLFTFGSLWRGVPDSTRMIAEDWFDNPAFGGVPSLYQRQLFWVIRIVAFVVILVEWVCFSFVTVFVVMWIVS